MDQFDMTSFLPFRNSRSNSEAFIKGIIYYTYSKSIKGKIKRILSFIKE